MVTTWRVPEPHGEHRATLAVLRGGDRSELVGDVAHEYTAPVLSPDGALVACTRASRSTPHEPENVRLVVVPVDGSAPPRDVAPEWDRSAIERRWAPDGTALIVTADDDGRSPVFRIDLAHGTVTRLSGDHGAIDRWRRREALRRTLLTRPDLLERHPPTDEERRWLAEDSESPPRQS